MFYSLAKRPEIKAQNPSYGVGKLAQRLAEHWKTMDATQKEPYAAIARQDRERYTEQLKAYKKRLAGGDSEALQTQDSQKAVEELVKEGSPQDEEEKLEEKKEEELEEKKEEKEQPGGGVGMDSELEQLCEFYQ